MAFEDFCKDAEFLIFANSNFSTTPEEILKNTNHFLFLLSMFY